MKVDAGLFGGLSEAPEQARRLEAEGYDGIVAAEIASDPFFPLLLAAEHTERIELMTSIAVGFARSPMTLANVGHDLNAYSRGRFILGLGSQIRPHITRRFSMPWGRPAAQMRELILALRAIWDCWYGGSRLDFRGEYYTHTLMTPMFTPTNTRYGPPRVFLAAVGPLMTQVAGEVADGMIVHAFTTARYLQEVTLPAVEKGLAAGGRSRGDFALSCPVFVVSGADERAFQEARRAVSKQIAFYGSTPAYCGVLELHGWGGLQGELNALSKRGEWDAMGALVTDEILEAFAVVAEPARVAAAIRDRYAGAIDRVTCTFPFARGEERRAYLEELRGAPAA
jgi:probable F420-dependent oxidoreductase